MKFHSIEDIINHFDLDSESISGLIAELNMIKSNPESQFEESDVDNALAYLKLSCCKRFWKSYQFIIVSCSVILILCLSYFCWGYSRQNNDSGLASWGQLGDSFGAINALFAGFAFAGLIYTILLQKRELSLQRRELKETREELKLQRKEFHTQNSTLKLQQFENTFFNMLSLQQQIVNDLCYTNKDKIWLQKDTEHGIAGEQVLDSVDIKGRELFFFSFREIEHHMTMNDGEKKDAVGMRGYLHFKGLDSYDDSYTPSYFDHYFRHLYTIIKFVDKSTFLSFEERYKYTTMVRATLSRYELVWLYYNGISSVGRPKFKKLIEEYSLLKNIRESLLTLSKENNDIIISKGFNQKWLFDNGYSGTDYEFWVTTTEHDSSKYYVKAFYNNHDLEEGIRKVNEWKIFYNENLK